VGAERVWTEREQSFVAGMSQFVSSALVARAHTAVEAAALRAMFLDKISLRLTSLNEPQIQGSAVALCVPTLGEVCLMWRLLPDGQLECVALKHVDPGKEADVLEIARRVASDRSSLTHLAVRLNQSVIVPEVDPTTARRYDVPSSERPLVTRLGFRSGMAVPLMVGGKAFGAMTFVASGRIFDADDLALAENVAARVTSALENARLYEVAREAVRARDELLVLTAHELRTPVQALQLRTEELQRRTQHDAEVGDAVADLTQQVKRFGAIVGRVLEALNIRAEGIRLERRPCDLVATVEDRVRRVAGRAERARSPITVASPASIVGNWDRSRLEMVVDVLLDNAIKFGAGAPIALTLLEEESIAELSIRDEGVGIPVDRLSTIFQPFERAVPKESYGGLGLGLYIAKTIVEAHGGSIEVTSQLGHGATFVVRLPLG
jgi:signal transduction histidine kinase